MSGAIETSSLLTAALAGAAGLGALLLAVWAYLRLGWRTARPVVEAYPEPDAASAATEALKTFHIVKKRAWDALFRGTLLLAAYEAAVAILGGGVFLLAARERLADAAPTLQWWESVPLVGRYAACFAVLGSITLLLIGGVYHCRLILRVRAGKSTRWKYLSEELDAAMAHGGILHTLFFGAAAALVIAVWLGLWGFAGARADLAAGLDSGAGWVLGLLAGGALAWGVLLGAMFAFPILALRDPGWLSGVEAGIGMLVLRRKATWRAGLYFTAMAASVYYWPAALLMLLNLVDDQTHLITVLLREREPRDVLKEMEAEAPAQETVLRQAAELERAGRYLDALNIYQMFYYKNPMHLGALEGISRAQLCIGNRTKAREALERLLTIDPSHAGGVRLMSEFQQGLWDEGGAMFQKARERCTQQLGKGVELKDTLDPALVREIEKR